MVQAREASTAHVNTFVRGPAWSRRTLTVGSRRVFPNGSSQTPTPPPLTAPSRTPSGTCGRRFTFGDRTDKGRRRPRAARPASGEARRPHRGGDHHWQQCRVLDADYADGEAPVCLLRVDEPDRSPGVVVLLALARTPVGPKDNDDKYQGRQRKGPGPVSHGNGKRRAE